MWAASGLAKRSGAGRFDQGENEVRREIVKTTGCNLNECMFEGKLPVKGLQFLFPLRHRELLVSLEAYAACSEKLANLSLLCRKGFFECPDFFPGTLQIIRDHAVCLSQVVQAVEKMPIGAVDGTYKVYTFLARILSTGLTRVPALLFIHISGDPVRFEKPDRRTPGSPVEFGNDRYSIDNSFQYLLPLGAKHTPLRKLLSV